MLSGVMLSIIVVSVARFSVLLMCHYAKCHYAECHYADCRGAKTETPKIKEGQDWRAQLQLQQKGGCMGKHNPLFSKCLIYSMKDIFIDRQRNNLVLGKVP